MHTIIDKVEESDNERQVVRVMLQYIDVSYVSECYPCFALKLPGNLLYPMHASQKPLQHLITYIIYVSVLVCEYIIWKRRMILIVMKYIYRGNACVPIYI